MIEKFNPYPGLRPFEPHENYVFFGREGQSNELLSRLRKNRFLAVVGTSGSGKSSLVRAGLLPDLHSGLMSGVSSHWHVALFRPGGDPIGNLAEALCQRDVLLNTDVPQENMPLQVGFMLATLKRSARGIIEGYKQSGLAPEENVLILVDQFEELFRFKSVRDDGNASNEAAAFVKLLLSAAKERDVPLYVAITMRSDFLGDCAGFRDLPEAINDGQYLIPRMTRDERRQAITGPAGVGGAQMTPRLVQRLLNDVGDNPDQLPILQHALMRTWHHWQSSAAEDTPLDIPDYEAVGGMENALSHHADEIYFELAEGLPEEAARRRQQIVEKLFKSLTEKGKFNRETRRPQKLCDIAAITGANEQEVIEIIEAFRRPGRSFLMPPVPEPLASQTLIDISHESLIRNWARLKAWVADEAESARIYTRLVETAELFRKGKASYYRDADLKSALEWQEREQPGEAWSRSYGDGYDAAMKFLQESRLTNEKELAEKKASERKQLRRTQAWLLVVGFISVIAIGLAWYATSLLNSIRDEHERRSADFLQSSREADDPFIALSLKGEAIAEMVGLRPAPDFRDTLLHETNVLLPHFRLAMIALDSSGIAGAAISHDGSRILTWRNDSTNNGCTINELDVATGDTVFSPRSFRKRQILDVIFTKDGSRFLTRNADGTMQLWKADDGSEVRLWKADARGRDRTQTMRHDNLWVGPLLLENDNLLVTWSSGNTAVWDVARGERIKDFQTGGRINGIVVNRDSSRMLTWNRDSRMVLLWDLSSFAVTDSLVNPGPVNGALFSRDGKTIVTWCSDTLVLQWNTTGDSLLSTVTFPRPVSRDIRFLGEVPHVMTWSWANRSAQLWDLTRNTPTGDSLMNIRRVLYSGVSRTFLTLSDLSRLRDGLSIPRGGNLWRGDGTRDTLAFAKGAAYSRDGSSILLWCTDGSARILDTAAKQLGTQFQHGGNIDGARFSGNGHSILTWSSDGVMKVWNREVRKPDTSDFDRDFPLDSTQMQIFALTGAQYDSRGGGIEDFSKAQWESAYLEPYLAAAKKHYAECTSKKYNVWRRFFDFGTISGKVIDNFNDPVDNAIITVETSGKDTIPPVISARDGKFAIAYIPYGTYRVRISRPGYNDWRSEDIVLDSVHKKLRDIRIFHP